MQKDPKNNNVDSAQKTIPFYNDPKKRSILFQAATLLVVALAAFYLLSNTLTNLEKQSIATGIGFLQKEAAFEIGESPIPYSAADTYGRALVVGFLNTLIVSFIGSPSGVKPAPTVQSSIEVNTTG